MEDTNVDMDMNVEADVSSPPSSSSRASSALPSPAARPSPLSSSTPVSAFSAQLGRSPSTARSAASVPASGSDSEEEEGVQGDTPPDHRVSFIQIHSPFSRLAFVRPIIDTEPFPRRKRDSAPTIMQPYAGGQQADREMDAEQDWTTLRRALSTGGGARRYGRTHRRGQSDVSEYSTDSAVAIAAGEASRFRRASDSSSTVSTSVSAHRRTASVCANAKSRNSHSYSISSPYGRGRPLYPSGPSSPCNLGSDSDPHHLASQPVHAFSLHGLHAADPYGHNAYPKRATPTARGGHAHSASFDSQSSSCAFPSSLPILPRGRIVSGLTDASHGDEHEHWTAEEVEEANQYQQPQKQYSGSPLGTASTTTLVPAPVSDNKKDTNNEDVSGVLALTPIVPIPFDTPVARSPSRPLPSLDDSPTDSTFPTFPAPPPRATPSPTESHDSAILTTPHTGHLQLHLSRRRLQRTDDHADTHGLSGPKDLCCSLTKGPPFGAFPSPPPRRGPGASAAESITKGTNLPIGASPSSSALLLPSLPITPPKPAPSSSSTSTSSENNNASLAEAADTQKQVSSPMPRIPMDEQTDHWRVSHAEEQDRSFLPTPSAFAHEHSRAKSPSVPSSTRTASTSSALPLETPPTSLAALSQGSRRHSKFTTFSGSSCASSLYSSDSERERHYRVTEHPDISTVFEEGSQLGESPEKQGQAPTTSLHHAQRPSQSRQNTTSHLRTGTVSSTRSGGSAKSVHPFAAAIHRAPSPPSSAPPAHLRATSPHLASGSSQPNIQAMARMQTAPAHQVTLAEEGVEDEEKCPICVESLSCTYRLPGEKPHVVPECGHALHEECFVTVYGDVPTHGSKRNIGLCGVCRQKMRIVEGGGERKRSKGKKLDLLMGSPQFTPPLRHAPSINSFQSAPMAAPPAAPDLHGDDPIDTLPSSTSSRSLLGDGQTKVVVPSISIRSEYSSVSRGQSKPSTAMITIQVPPAPSPDRYPAGRRPGSLRSTSSDVISSNLPHSPLSPGSTDIRTSFGSHNGLIPPLNPFAHVEADLKHRVIDYKNSGLDNLGVLRLYDMIAIRKGSMLRDFLMYLYNDALICISEEKPSAFQKMFSSGSSMRSNDTRSTGGTSSGRGSLKLRGRVYVKHIKKIVDSSLPAELSITILMENESMEPFILTFKEKASHETWKSTLQRVVDESRIPPPSAGGNSMSKIARLMGAGAPSPTVQPRSAKAPTPGIPSSTSMGFAPSFTDSSASPSSPAFSSSREASAGDLITTAPLAPVHTPLDLVIVLSLPTTPSGAPLPLKLRLMRQSLAFVLALLGSRDRISIVSCELGTTIRRTPLLNPTRYDSRRRLEDFVEAIGTGPIPNDEFEVQTQPDERYDVVTAMNVALDVILQRKVKNPLTGMILISDTADVTKRAQMDLVCARLDAANIPVHSLGYGKSHDPTPLWMVSNHTHGTYTFVREWYHLRDRLAGVVGGLTTIALTNMKLHLSAQENEFRIVKITGTPQPITCASGRSVDIELRELRYGETRELLVELELTGEGSPRNSAGSDGGLPIPGRPGPGSRQGSASMFRRSPSIMGGIDGMSVTDTNSLLRDMVYEEGMVDEVPVIEVDCSFHDPSAGRSVSRLAHPVLLTLAVLPSSSTSGISPDPTVQRRKMELIAADMLTRAILLLSRKNFSQAHKLLSETRRIIQTISDGMRSTLPPSGPARSKRELAILQAVEQLDNVVADLDALCEALEESPDLFMRDQRNFMSQQGIVIRSQTSWTVRTGSERWYCTDDVRRIIQMSGEWNARG